MGPRNESVVEAMDGHTSFQMPVETFLRAVQDQVFFCDDTQQGSVRWDIADDNERAPKRRFAFRVRGFLLLVLSVNLPFLTWVAPESLQASVASSLWMWGAQPER